MRPGFGTDFSDGYKAKSSEVFKVLLRFSKFSSYCVGLSSGDGWSLKRAYRECNLPASAELWGQ